eukprot:TRINITY_DN1494_c0_g1::TRINITY_DN1494_c0_g1_i1::g.27291::m.27291 TRINITY_DN1494_c0_g1::TRINITY_DN1494_c0_g1_i1::g.27291  ORF type:complete len:519 (-),score=73.80,Peptidase_M23/PF01551.17/1.4e-08,RnfC_N/PF13375.1/13,RnfC_N/PF13375.1/6e+02,RnfC_N/PF13375.1/3.1e+02 TRINITY_DN1494_c0_g1_i1:49-1578(-)
MASGVLLALLSLPASWCLPIAFTTTEYKNENAGTPAILFSLGEVIPFVPKTLDVYFDPMLYDGSTLQVSLLYNEEIANCHVSPRYDSSSFNFLACAESFGLSLAPPLDLELTLSASIGGAENHAEVQNSLHLLVPPRRPWPLENEDGVWPPNTPNLAANIMEDYQSFSGAQYAYWHQGLDIRSNLYPDGMGGIVHSPVAGKVVNVIKYSSSDLYWSVMVQDDMGYIFQVHHMDKTSITVKTGQVIPQGHVLGRIARWPESTNGELYHHIHMNVVRAHPSWTSIPAPYVDGWQYFNPLHLLDHGKFNNTGVAPSSNGRLFFLENDSDKAFAATSSLSRTAITVSGDVDIIINLYDLFESTNNVPGHPYPLGLYEVTYSVSPVDAHIPSHASVYGVVVRADKLPADTWRSCFPDFTTAASDAVLREVYRQRFSYQGTSYTSVFDYNRREFYYTVTNVHNGQPDASRGYWDTDAVLLDGSSRFPNGLYNIRVTAADYWNNTFSVEHTVQVRN